MESKILSFKASMIVRDIKKHWPIWACALTLFVLSVTMLNALGMRFNIDAEEYAKRVNEDIFDSLLGSSMVISYLLGIAGAIAAFGFLGKKKKHYFFEALPMNRVSLFGTRYLFGLILVLLPTFGIYLIEILQSLILCGSPAMKDLTVWLILSIGMHIFWYSFGVLFMILSGKMIMSGFCYIAFSLLGILLEMSFGICSAICYIGVDTNWINLNHLGILSPLEFMYQFSGRYTYLDRTYVYENINVGRIFVLFAAAIVLTAVSVILFKKRKAERTGDNMVFNFMRYIFSWSFAFVFSLEFTIFCTGIFLYDGSGIAHRSDSSIMIIIFLILFGIIGYFISCMILEKRFKVFKTNLVKALIFIGVLVLLGVGFLHDIFGIEKYIPDTDKIDTIRIDNDIRWSKGWKAFKSDEAKKIAAGLHKIFIDNIDELKSYKEYEENINIRYYFEYYYKDGTEIERRYYVKDGGKLSNEIDAYMNKYQEYFTQRTSVDEYQ